jgi:uncharacterized NAD-dependent epimerase/dehydratase family protein
MQHPLQELQIRRPYLIFIGDVTVPLGVKTGLGIVEWRPEWCLGQFRLSSEAVDLGLEDMTPAIAASRGGGTMIIGGASFGGVLPEAWEGAILAALDAGLDVAAGLHEKLSSRPRLVERARALGRRLIDVRGVPDGAKLPIATGRRRTGRRVLTVGTDCAVGKKFTALALEQALRKRAVPATFRATGQTGVFISGGGLAIDSVVSDFVAGAAELLSPDASPDHWDVIEGQGSLFHPAYAGVSLGLLHGSQPDAIVVCSEAGRAHLLGYPDFALPALEACIAHTLHCARLTNPEVRCAGVSLNTASLDEEARRVAIDSTQQRLGLPCIDPAVTGADAIAAVLSGWSTGR